MNRNRLRSCLLGLAGLVCALAATPAAAARWLDVSIINRSTGERLTPYRHDGRLYVAGRPGDRYAIELRNTSGQRALAVVSVDGVNVLTGETAASGQSGYVLDAWRTYGINGWRKSLDEVAQFVFTALPDSYAARTGRPDNVGVIGVAVFREKPVPPIAALPAPEPGREANSALARERAADAAQAAGSANQPGAPAPSAKAESRADTFERREAKSAERLGTGHGEREHSPTRYTEFVRASDAPDEVLRIYYDSHANLVARGIIHTPRVAEPKAFPGDNGFVPDPRG